MKNALHYQLVLSDIDGTLLNDNFKLLPSTESTIRDLVRSGVLFATASARNKIFAENAISTIKEVCCANAYVNGAFTEVPNGEVLIDSPMKPEDTSILIDQCQIFGRDSSHFR